MKRQTETWGTNLAALVTMTPWTLRQAKRLTSLLIIETVVDLSVFTCGIGLLVNGLGIALSELDTTPFNGFLIPGSLLTFAVGVPLLHAAWLIGICHALAPQVSFAAGSNLLGWRMVGMIVVGIGRLVRAVVFLLALSILVHDRNGILIPVGESRRLRSTRCAGLA